MTFKTLTPIYVLPLVPVVALTLALSTGAARYRRPPSKTRPLHVTKECSEYTGAAGSVLYDHVLEPREDQGRLEGLRPTGGYSGRLAGQQRRPRRREWKQGGWPLHTRSDDLVSDCARSRTGPVSSLGFNAASACRLQFGAGYTA
mgnify:CR=1 FL=1